jgi:RAB6A-GEF complex partner protein 2
MSEQPSVLSDRPQLPSAMIRKQYRLDSQQPRNPQAANLLMGYAHLNATFIVDGSLVDQSQFEEVKKKGFLGGQAGGGVVGVKKSRPTSGFLGGFNFNSIGESLNNLVGVDTMSSVREMTAVTNSRAVPLLSTPQSLLFVDLHLEPGEERSFSFSCTLPRGLPSSYRGKTIKILYNVLIGVQGVPGQRDVRKVRQISVPVRVFSGVDSHGEVLGHDLMQPHVLLRDIARTKAIDPTDEIEKPLTSTSKSNGTSEDFLQYVETLLDRNRRRQSSSGTMDVVMGTGETPDSNPTVQAINQAIMFSNQLSAKSSSSSNHFEISRGGQRVAVVKIDRNLHRLGETVTAVIDFNDGELPTASLHATLETTEKVESSLAIRSAASISRVTRRIYASHSDNVLFSKRSVFTPTIPAAATPTFITSGISLEWSLRFEFGTIRPVEVDDGEESHDPELFEDVVKDERGVVSIAVERLDCETFEVVIPITVYGDIVRDGEDGGTSVGVPI